MKSPHMHSDYSIVTVMGYDATHNVYEVQVDPIGDGGSHTPAEARHPYGFLGIPNDGDTDGNGNYNNGAFARIDHEGSTDHVLVLDDLRVTALLPQLPKGSSAHYGKGANGVARAVATDSYEITVPANAHVKLVLEGGPTFEISGNVVKCGGSGSLVLTTEMLVELGKISTAIGSLGGTYTPPTPPWGTQTTQGA